jgi:hypothetical protein
MGWATDWAILSQTRPVALMPPETRNEPDFPVNPSAATTCQSVNSRNDNNFFWFPEVTSAVTHSLGLTD